MRNLLTLAIVLAWGTSFASAVPPNIILIVSDDQGYPDLGCIGSKPIQTPHLDRVAAEGVRATSFYVTCQPVRPHAVAY